jgi:hypothetical protein
MTVREQGYDNQSVKLRKMIHREIMKHEAKKAKA